MQPPDVLVDADDPIPWLLITAARAWREQYGDQFEGTHYSSAANRFLYAAEHAWFDTAPEVEEPPLIVRGYRKLPIPPALRWEVWERDDFTCKDCGTRRNLSVDHVFPESLGGTLDLDNLQTLCVPCNARKGARVPG